MKPMHKLDLALVEIAKTDISLTNGFTNHAPMVVEALDDLGQGRAIAAWLTDTRPTLLPKPAPQAHLDRQGIPGALGQPDRYADWCRFFEDQLAARSWQEVVANWVPILAPGFMGGLLHGAIRTAHALRALCKRETPARKAELGHALASWAATYRAPVVDIPPIHGARSMAKVFAELPILPEAQQKSAGAITTGLMALKNVPNLAHLIASADLSGAPDDVRRQMASVFAGIFCTHIDTPHRAIGFTHALTGLAATEQLAAHVPGEETPALLRMAWVAGCLLHAARSTPRPFADRPAGRVPDPDDLIRNAVSSGDDHNIKLTHACLGYYRQTKDAVFLHCIVHGQSLMD